MELDFYLLPIIDENDGNLYSIKVMDNTLPNQISPITTIYSMTLDIVGSNVENGGVYGIDLIPYVTIYKQDKELYEITGETIGLEANAIIPDGVYTLTWTINNIITKTNKFCVYYTAKKAVDELLTNVSYNIDVTNNDVDMIGDYCNGDIEQIRLAQAMIDALRVASADEDEESCTDLLDKLNRLLTLINGDYGKSNYRR